MHKWQSFSRWMYPWKHWLTQKINPAQNYLKHTTETWELPPTMWHPVWLWTITDWNNSPTALAVTTWWVYINHGLAVHCMTFLLRCCCDFNYNWYNSVRVNDYVTWGDDVDCPQSVPTCKGLLRKNVCHQRNPSPGPFWSEPTCRLRLACMSLNVLEIVPRDNMSDHRGLIITLTEGALLNFPHIVVQGNPKIRLHGSPHHPPLCCIWSCHPFCKG